MEAKSLCMSVVSERGVVFFLKQDNLTSEPSKKYILCLGEVSGGPLTSTLYIHPILNDINEFDVGNDEISTLSRQEKNLLGSKTNSTRRSDSEWHSDIQLEPCSAYYTSLRLIQLPKSGSDTLWAYR